MSPVETQSHEEYASAARAWLTAFGQASPTQGTGRFAPRTLKEVLDGALSLGRGAGCLPEAMRVIGEAEVRLGALHRELEIDRRAGTVGDAAPPRVAIVTEVGRGSVRVAGRWVPDLAAAAGAVAVLARSGGPDLEAAPAEVMAESPTLVVFALRGATLAEGAVAAGDFSNAMQRAVGTVAMDGRRYVVEPGPGLVRSVEILAAAIHNVGPAPTPDELTARTLGAA